ncbi:hypothetical protein DSO57_1007442 [Entomophthora muscae]|uniref:Uncharacterized protein n=1 Tax=Entomophthora muscae TaxID=34485 RepID=A0ACC2U5L4_9FUNG|nr:hypothetical protein DSO57_1007442 [Entomophthora muscae]
MQLSPSVPVSLDANETPIAHDAMSLNPHGPATAESLQNRIQGWVEGLSAAITALEQVAPLLVRDSQANSVQLHCSVNQPNLSPRRKKVQNKRGRSSPELELSARIGKLCSGIKSLEFNSDSTNLDSHSPYPRSNLKLTKHHRINTRKDSNENQPENLAVNTPSLTFSQKNHQHFENLSLDMDFIEWLKAKAKSLRLGPQECFDLIRLNFSKLTSGMDQVNRLLGEASYTSLDQRALFGELKDCLLEAVACLDWITNKFNSSELTMLFPSWTFLQMKLLQAQRYIQLVEDMYCLVSNYPPVEPTQVLALLEEKTRLYEENLVAKSQAWHISGFPPCTDLLEEVNSYLLRTTCECAERSLIPLEEISCNVALSGEILENWLTSFQAGSKCLALTGINHNPLINSLYQLEIQLLIATCKESEARLAYAHLRKERRDWEVWLTTRLDILASQINKLHCWPRPRHHCVVTGELLDFDSPEAQLCYALVDLVLRICHAFTSFAQESRTNVPTLRRGFSVSPKPTAYLLFTQILGLVAATLPFSFSRPLECRIKTLSEKFGLVLS